MDRNEYHTRNEGISCDTAEYSPLNEFQRDMCSSFDGRHRRNILVGVGVYTIIMYE